VIAKNGDATVPSTYVGLGLLQKTRKSSGARDGGKRRLLGRVQCAASLALEVSEEKCHLARLKRKRLLLARPRLQLGVKDIADNFPRENLARV
jgi:hypothetical protein